MRYWVTATALCLALTVGLIVGVLLLVRTQCNVTGDEMNRAVRFRVLGGCFVEDGKGGFVHVDNFREVDE